MHLVPVETQIDRQEFLTVARTIYADDPHWVCPLDPEIEGIFNPAKNRKLIDGKAQRWVLKDNHQQPIGRIAAFIDPSYVTMSPAGQLCVWDGKILFVGHGIVPYRPPSRSTRECRPG